MGKQINFYIGEITQNSFIQYLQENEFLFWDKRQNVIQDLFEKSVSVLYLYKPNYGEMIMHKDYRDTIDIIKSPLIQFNKTLIKEDKKKIIRGRIWIEDKFYSDDGDCIKKDKVFVDDYMLLMKWIKKNAPLQEIPKGEHFVKEHVSSDLNDYLENGFIFSI